MNWKFWQKKKEDPQLPKNPVKEWIDAIVFAVVAATFIRWLFIEAYTIPTPSMEKSLLVGDFLFVSKMHYGARTPQTPLQVPLTHQKIWGTEIPSYLDWIQLPMLRFPGFADIKNNDVIVFNYPPDEGYPVDLKTNYIKRCIAIPNDVLEIKDMQVYINGKASENPQMMQHGYYVKTKTDVRNKVFKKFDITDFNKVPSGYVVHSSKERIEELKKGLDVVEGVMLLKDEKGVESEKVFPQSRLYHWNLDYFGPLTIPAKGMTIKLDSMNLSLYESVIKKYEHLENVEINKNGKLLINGKEVSEYTFTQNYYFAMGDNRRNSLDSRIWGFIPEDHILGKGLLIWWSVDPDGDFTEIFSKIRWDRIGKLIE